MNELTPEQRQAVNREFQKNAGTVAIIILGITAIIGLLMFIHAVEESQNKHAAEARKIELKALEDGAKAVIAKNNLTVTLKMLLMNHGNLYKPATDSLIVAALNGNTNNFNYWVRRLKGEKELIYEQAVNTNLLNELRSKDAGK